MTLCRSVKYRLYPNAAQKALLHESFGLYRFVFNSSLGQIKDFKYGEYEVTKGKNIGTIYPSIPSITTLVGSSTSLKEEFNFVKKLSNDYVQASLTDLTKAFKGFYSGKGYPKFKSRKDLNQSFTIYAGSRIKIKDNEVILSISKESSYSKDDHKIKFKKHKTNLDGIDTKTITSSTISKDNLGHYWISINYKYDIPLSISGFNKPIGIDLGIKSLLVDSDGNSIGNPNTTKKHEKALRKAQRSLSKKKRGSKNRAKKRLKVAKIHNKIKDVRNHRNHTISRSLVNLYDFIALETLDIKGMINKSTSGMSKAIYDIAWSSLVQKIEYKQAENQGIVSKIITFYPSSKACSRCGSIKESLALSERVYKCLECGLELDRDHNAAKNILNEGLRLHKKKTGIEE